MANVDFDPTHVYPRGTTRLGLTLAALLLGACGDSGGGTGTATEGSSNPGTEPTTVPPGGTDPSNPSNPTTSGSGSATESGTSTGPDGTDSATETATGDLTATTTTGGGLKLDVGAELTTGDTGEEMKGCRKVDFLFVIDNSGSMADEQQNLIASFPSFIQTIQDELELATDYHIMVIDTDAYVFSQCPLICNILQTCLVAGDDYVCGTTQPEECEDVLGAGVIHPKGADSSSKNCEFVSGGRYMDINEPDLSATFACAAQVGSGSTDDPEKPMQAMVAAVAPAGPSAECNTGFLRQDAILVVTFITDEDDNPGDGSAGTVDGWRASLIAAKKGDESALVVLGLFGDGDLINPVCPPFNEDAASGAEASPRLRQFVESFGDHGIAGSVCADSYQPFFQQAVSVIDSTCDDFVPPPM